MTENEKKMRDPNYIPTIEEALADPVGFVAGMTEVGMPSCPKCGSTMQGGAPHGPWPLQYECPRCGEIVIPKVG